METTFKDHKIEVTPEFQFRVTGPLYEGKATFGSVDDARADINKRAVALAQQRKAEAAVALAVLDDAGERATVRGIHASQGILLGVASGFVYPDVQWLRDLLIRRAELGTEMKAIESKLHPYRINARRQYGRVRTEDYELEISKLTAELNGKTTKAKEAGNV